MASRSSRSPASISTSPTTPRIEDLLNITANMHPVPSPRAQRVTGTHSHPIPIRRPLYPPPHPVHHSDLSTSANHDVVGISLPPTSSRRASFTATNIVPRVVRGTIANTGRDSSVIPPSAAPVSSSNRSALSLTRSVLRPATPASSQTHTRTTSTPLTVPPPTTTIIPPPSPHATAFCRPTYLDQSAFRHCLLSEAEPTAPPEQYVLGTLHSSAVATASRSGNTTKDAGDSDEDSNTGERGRTLTPALSQLPVETYMYLPTRWSETDRCPSLSVSVDGRELTFHGANASSDREAASARTNYHIPPACGVYYYEMKILDKGQKGHIGIGFGLNDVRLQRLPGWEGKSWGYHGDDGHTFAAEAQGSPYGPKFSTGDTIGCGIDFSSGRAFFTKNGLFLGEVFENLGSVGNLYPTVGLCTPNESIRANFGQDSFMYDIETHVQQARNRTWAKIQSTPIAWTSGLFTKGPEGSEEDTVKKPLNELVLGYLAHHGYTKAASAFQKQVEQRAIVEAGTRTPMAIDTDAAASSSSTALHSSNLSPDALLIQDDTVKRQRIVHAISVGDIDTALDETRKCYPSVLEREGGIIMFKLRCRKFIELVLEAAAAWRAVKEQETDAKGKETTNGTDTGAEMDIDDDNGHANGAFVRNGSNRSHNKLSPLTPSSSQIVLERAIMNGQSLQADYKSDPRQEVQTIYKQALSLVAYDDPLADDPRVPQSAKDMAGQAARDALAEEVNRAILDSQGRPPHPPLERLYRHTQACIVQLGWLGVGAAAYADMPKEFLEA